MRSSIHVRGLVVVGLVVVFALLATGQVLVTNPVGGTERFTIVTADTYPGQPVAYVLDTATGEVWSRDLDGEAFFAAKVAAAGDPNTVAPIY
jgi:hypothetical protein